MPDPRCEDARPAVREHGAPDGLTRPLPAEMIRQQLANEGDDMSSENVQVLRDGYSAFANETFLQSWPPSTKTSSGVRPILYRWEAHITAIRE